MKQVGFFKEFRGEKTYPSIKEALGKGNFEKVKDVLEFLAKGRVHVASPGVVRDPLIESRPIVGAAHILSVGKWMWPKEPSYFVEKYNVLMPEEFLAYIESH